ncbi:MAG: ribonuclease HI [Spirochaetaceae bacterium]|jgi:ribonuclease HI|nr:ribonuclease HI [Spirochaetaceae bacterium]
MDIHIYTDGGCSGNPGPGGWAYMIIRDRGEEPASRAKAPAKGAKVPAKAPPEVIVEKWGGEKETTNNRMELSAALAALDMLRKLNIAPKRVVVFTDSQYVQMGMTQWIFGWKRNGWRTSDKGSVKNQDLWQRLDELAALFPITWEWVKGHAGNPFNERCDKLTQQAIAAVQKE